MKRTLLVSFLLVCAAATTVSAGTITSISPASIKVNSGEHFITIYGSGLGSVIVFDGPAGHFELNANATFSGQVHFWVPVDVVRKSGYYSVYVKGGTGDSNSVTFEVQGFKFFPFVILVADIIKFQPQNREGGYAKYEVLTGGGDPSAQVSVSCFPESGSFFKMGSTPVRCSASNSAGEKSTAEFNLVMADEVPPVIKVPTEPIVVKAESREGARVYFDVSAYDEIWGDAKPECNPQSGSVFPVGVTNVQCNATDFDGNLGINTFIIEVLGEVKWYPLTVKVPDRVAVDARSVEGEKVEWKVEVTGTKDRLPTVTCNPEVGSLFPIGFTLVRCDAIDMYGMRGSGEFYVEVRDPYAPKFSKLYASPDILPGDGRVYPIEVVASAYDDLDPAPVCSVFAVTSNQDSDLDDNESEKAYDWQITGDLTVNLRGEFTRVDRVYNIWVGCTDFYGNRVNSTARVVVPANSGGTSAPTTSSKRRSTRP